MTEHRQKKRKFWHSGIIKHPSRVALSPARVLTSHLRYWFHGKYKDKYRLAKVVFVFDLLLAFLALCLLVFNVVILYKFSYFGDAGLKVVFNAKPLKASDAAPLQIKVSVADGKTHQDVSLRWHLPEWVEILRSEPRLGADNNLFFGTLRPGEEKISTIYVRFRAPKGTEVPIVFNLHQFDVLGFYRDQRGYEMRKVEDVSLSAEPALPARFFSRGALLPIIVNNKSSLTAEAVTLELLFEPGLSRVHFLSDQKPMTDGQRTVLGNIEPGKKKAVYVVLPSDQDTVRLKWNLLERSHTVHRNYVRYDVSTSSAVWSAEDVNLEISGKNLVLNNPAKRSGQVFVDHPGLAERNFITVPLCPTTTVSTVILENAASTSSRRWTAIIVEDSNGGIIGPMSGGYLSSSLPLKTSVRYYTDLGDQIGIGPMPPQLGATTTFWVVWDLGPLEYGLADVHLETVLPAGVTATGIRSSAYGGDFEVQGKKVSWFLPQGLPASPGESVKLSFEISFTPKTEMIGKIVPLIGLTRISGKDPVFGREFMSENIPGDNTKLESDERARGSGIVSPRP